MPTLPHPHSDRGRELHCFSSDFQHRFPFRHISICGTRSSRSSSVSSATGSVHSDTSLASSATSYSGHSYSRDSDVDNTDYSDDERVIVDVQFNTHDAQAPRYELQSKNRTEDTALTLGGDAPFDPQSCMSSPTDEEHCTTPGRSRADPLPSLPSHAVLCDGHASDNTLPNLSTVDHDHACDGRTPVCPIRSHFHDSGYGRAPPLTAVQDCPQTNHVPQESHASPSECSIYEPICSDTQKNIYPSSFGTNGPHSKGPPVNRRTTDVLSARRFPESSEGPQRLSSNPRRTKTDASWCKPPLVRQEIRKKTYVQTLIGKSNLPQNPHPRASAEKKDVAVSLIAYIWPASERPLQVHNSTMGTTVIDLRYFVEQILRRSYASHSTLQLALYYCCKLHWSGELPQRSLKNQSRSHSKRDLPLLCGRRMFLASLMLAFKFLQDRNYSSRAWSTISGLSITDINQNEFRLLEALQYRTFVSAETYNKWQKVVEAHADQMNAQRSIAWRRTLSLCSPQAEGRVCAQISTNWSHPIEELPDLYTSDRSGQRISTEMASSERKQDHGLSPPYSHLPTPPESSPLEGTAVKFGHLEALEANAGDLAKAEAAGDAAISPGIVSTLEDMAACISLPYSPGDMGPIAPLAPHLGIVTPPESSPDQAGQCAEFIRITTHTINDHDSGYDSSSPLSSYSEAFGNSQVQLDLTHMPDESEDHWCAVVIEPDPSVASDSSCLQDEVRRDFRCEIERFPNRMTVCDRNSEGISTAEIPWNGGPEPRIERSDTRAARLSDEGYESDDSVEYLPTVINGDCTAPDINEMNLSRDDLYEDYDLQQYENDMDDGKGLRQHKSKKHAAPPHGKRFHTLAQAIQKRSHEKACGQASASSQHRAPKKSKKPKLGPC